MIRQLFLIRWIIKMVGNNNKEKKNTHTPLEMTRWKREDPNANAKATPHTQCFNYHIYLFVCFSFAFAHGRTAVCSLDCGPNGICESGKCRCNPGFVGNLCDQLPCDTRCAEHGQCKNGTCVCSQGWNGRHCTLCKYLVHSRPHLFFFSIFFRFSYFVFISFSERRVWSQRNRYKK